MKVVECWEVLSWDGGERHNHKYFLLSEAEAETYKVANKHDIVSKRVFTFFDSIAEAEDNTMQKIRERALAKLSAVERKSLGY